VRFVSDQTDHRPCLATHAIAPTRVAASHRHAMTTPDLPRTEFASRGSATSGGGPGRSGADPSPAHARAREGHPPPSSDLSGWGLESVVSARSGHAERID